MDNMRHYLQFLLDKNFIPWTDGKIETLKYYLSFDYKVMAKIGTTDEWHIAYVTLDENTSYIFSWVQYYLLMIIHYLNYLKRNMFLPCIIQ